MAFLAASRSTCSRRKVGAVIVKERRVLGTGYNGPPIGMVHCTEVSCVRIDMDIPSGQRRELCRGLDAEQNAIIQAAVHGTSIKGGVIYVTAHPCVICSKMIINAQLTEIIYADGYPDELSELMLIESGLPTRRFSLPVNEVAAMIGEKFASLKSED